MCSGYKKKGKKKRRNVVVQARCCSDTETERKLLETPSGYWTNYFPRDNILLSFTSPVPATERRRALMNAPQSSQDKAHVKDTGRSETSLQGLIDTSVSESRIWPYVTAFEEIRGQSPSCAWQTLHPTGRNLDSVFCRPSVSLSGDLPESHVT